MVDSTPFDWSSISDSDFENLCFDLLRAMGFGDVDWRRGTDRAGRVADGGRDIECTWRRFDADGENVVERWFVQAKRYSGGVPPEKIADAFAWAAAERPDVLLIVTTSFLSNPAKTWIDDYARNNSPAFRVKVWEKPRLQELLSKYPAIPSHYRVTTDPVSSTWQALLHGWRTYGLHASEDALQFVWQHSDSIAMDDLARYFVLRSEFAGGDMVVRPWLDRFTEQETADLVVRSLFALPIEAAWTARLGRDPATTKSLVGVIVKRLVEGKTSLADLANRLWSPQDYVQAASDLEKAQDFATNLRQTLLQIALTETVEASVNACTAGCGVSRLTPLEGGDMMWSATAGGLAGQCRLNLSFGDEEPDQSDMCPALLLYIFFNTGGGAYVAKDAFGPGNPPETIASPMQVETIEALSAILNLCREVLHRTSSLLQGNTDFSRLQIAL